jgi:hypothetical protein
MERTTSGVIRLRKASERERRGRRVLRVAVERVVDRPVLLVATG